MEIDTYVTCRGDEDAVQSIEVGSPRRSVVGGRHDGSTYDGEPAGNVASAVAFAACTRRHLTGRNHTQSNHSRPELVARRQLSHYL